MNAKITFAVLDKRLHDLNQNDAIVLVALLGFFIELIEEFLLRRCRHPWLIHLNNKMNEKQCDYIFKFILIGNGNSGKTSLLYYFQHAARKSQHNFLREPECEANLRG